MGKTEYAVTLWPHQAAECGKKRSMLLHLQVKTRHKNGADCYSFDDFINLGTKIPKLMATQPKSMSIIKQVLTDHINSLSLVAHNVIRLLAKKLPQLLKTSIIFYNSDIEKQGDQ